MPGPGVREAIDEIWQKQKSCGPDCCLTPTMEPADQQTSDKEHELPQQLVPHANLPNVEDNRAADSLLPFAFHTKSLVEPMLEKSYAGKETLENVVLT